MTESLYNMDLQYITHTDNTYNVTAVRYSGYSQCRGSNEPCLWSTDGVNYNGVLSITWPGAPYPYAQTVTWKGRQESEYFFSKYVSENKEVSQQDETQFQDQ